ncbi:hypothetical protein [Halorubrum sp. Atlit-26R]|uniref:hypothetical protein n=1 Tax=Halorubrum sp. Atlit-26R TaxID=2282128 RepID=UPI000EF2030E|nr:hypothetical protein [Halorubrum sp. Atlit-26R]RLM68469.1 hypothetical protein DVK07_10110 [Halorubrum sp. Atlit-26R]
MARIGGVATVLLLTVAVSPAAAQDGLVCESSFLENLFQTFVNFTTLSAVVIFVALYQLDAVMEMFAFGPERQKQIKQHKKKLWGGLLQLILIGPGITAFGSAVGWDFASCIDLVPF